MNRFALLMACSLSAAAAIAGVGCSGRGDPTSATPPAPAPAPPPAPPGGAVEPALTQSVLMPGLRNPWDLAFLPDGTMFFTEKCAGLSVRLPNGTVNRLLGMAGTTGYASRADDLFCLGQSGMHGVAVDPDFASNRYVYVFSASNLSTNPRTNRVLRLVVAPNLASVSGRVDIVTDIAFKDQANAVGGAGAHSGGRIRFGPDGYLYITTGDNHNATLPQDPLRLGGKVLRVDRNGAAAPGNNPPAGFDARIYTYGHRNVQGIAFRPGSGQPFIAEHGPNHSDEVTPLAPGGNGGWDPKNRPGLNCPDGYCGYAGNKTTMPMTDLARFPDALRPSWVFDPDGTTSRGMGPATFLVGSQWKAWDGRLAVGIMGAQRLELLTLDAAGMTTATMSLNGAPHNLPGARYRSLVQGPDGSLYIATDGGEIWRLVPN
jgi:glucose/arabinose dehydrogenase